VVRLKYLNLKHKKIEEINNYTILTTQKLESLKETLENLKEKLEKKKDSTHLSINTLLGFKEKTIKKD
jgi:hypothetical protein